MTLLDAVESYDEQFRPRDSSTLPLSPFARYLAEQTGDLKNLDEPLLRDFLVHWYMPLFLDRASQDSAVIGTAPLPGPEELCTAILGFVEWFGQQGSDHRVESARRTIEELRDNLPAAIELSVVLSNYASEKGGPFRFPEFLTSFEDGGRSEYDIDSLGEVGVLEGYFKILRVKGTRIDAEELISETDVSPVLFPAPIAELIRPGFIVNLELIRGKDGWQIAGCGLAYPPGTTF